ncbi:MAG: Hpt domain-containing protein [Nitrospirae bacterium]|nr:Hpt domain-containing protein [Nitrospirota bacterium]
MPEKIIVKVDPDIADLVPGYIDNRHRDIGLLSEALAKNDYDGLRKIGHDLKGSGSGYGFDKITEMGRTLESAAKSGDGTEIKKLIDELTDYLDRLEIVYE